MVSYIHFHMKAIVNILGIIGEIPDENGKIMTPNTTFLDVVSQIESNETANEIEVYINTPGGLVEEADLIFDYLENLKKSGVNVNTYAEDQCASAGVKLFLAGIQRIINDYTVFMIHNPWGQSPEGDADEIEEYSKGLRTLENDMINFYSKLTGTSKEAIKPLMKKETILTPQQAVELGFATSLSKRVALDAVAFSKKLNSNLNTSKTMAKESLNQDEAVNLLESLLTAAKNFGKKKGAKKPKGLKIVLDANAGAIEFPELNPDDTPAVGDKTTAEDGDYLLPSGETYVVSGGELSEIKPAESDDDTDDSEELAAAKEKISELEKKLSDAQNLKTESDAELKAMRKQFKSMSKNLKTLQRSIGSGFDHQGKHKNHKGGKGGKKSRSLFKSEED